MVIDRNPTPVGIFATDFDGTLHMPGREFHREDILALERLGSLNILRVIATGRSPFSFDRMMGERSLPIDYLVLSSGAGIQDYRTGELLWTASMNEALTSRAVNWLSNKCYDFCVQGKIPRNHEFTFSYTSGSNPDLERRIDLYTGYCRPIRECDANSVSTQVVIIVPPGRQNGVTAEITESLGDSYNILRTTSPLDGESLWIEVFPAGVSKSSGVEWLAARFGLCGSDAAAVGNDYNDHDLLQWAAHAFVVKDSPEHLRTQFREVPSVNEGGVAEAARLWLFETGRLSEKDCWPV